MILPGGATLERDHRLAARRGAAQRRLDLAELDAEAAQLDLVVEAARGTRCAPSARQRARSPVRYSRAPGAGEADRDEPLRGQLGPVEVAAANADAADVQLAGDADRHRLQRAVEHVDARCWRSAGRSAPCAALGVAAGTARA